MRMYDLIQKKRDNQELNKDEIEFFVNGYTKGEIPDYQASAFAMAVFFNGMTDGETFELTKAMCDSGEKADLSCFNGRAVDKHSTGGVGDKTTLIVAPIVASLGCFVAKMSGRGLGHTGGTVDKLESIKGYTTSLSSDEFIKQVKEVGVAVVGQTGNFAPADKKLYALRDVTATVDSIPLIASSIMSKKLAAGADVIVLDVKVGSGAFMKTVEAATELAKEMVKIGTSCNKKVSALITNMDVPLGKNIGNALEIKEAVEVLSGKSNCEDLKEICICLATEMVALSYEISSSKAREMAENALNSGKALGKFKEWISAQGGDTLFVDNLNDFCTAKFSYEIKTENAGYIDKMNAELIGKSASILGAGRIKKEDNIDFSAGIILSKKTGDYIKEGETIAILYSSSVSDFKEAETMFLSSIQLSSRQPDKKAIIHNIVY